MEKGGHMKNYDAFLEMLNVLEAIENK